jgi:hypothetical protein
MDDRKKIVLGSEDFLAKGVDDIYININLQQTFNQIKRDKYDNNFDLAEQFRKERNESRSFRIYGIVDSNIIDTYKDAGLTQYIGSVNTTPLVYSEQNVFAKNRGKYIIPLDNYDSNSIFIEIVGDNVTFATQTFEQQLVFFDLEGEFVEYGTETVDIGLTNEGFLTIENDFPFLYNKHWIKRDIEIVETKPAKVSFTTPSSIVPEGQGFSFTVALDRPSDFGIENLTMNAVLGTIVPGDYSISISGNPVTFPTTTISFSQGEQFKTFNFDAIEDDVYEFSENMIFKLENLNFVDSGETLEHTVFIEDTTPRRFTNYNFGEVYKNRLEFSGRTASSGGINPTTSQKSAYSILRNGLEFYNKNESFYPGDNYEILVTNEGIDTLLPENPSFGVGNESVWPAGTSKTLLVNTEYDNNNKHKVKLIFPQGFGYNTGEIRINGVEIANAGNLNFSTVSNAIVDGSSGDYIINQGYEKDWSAEVENSANTAITITSKVTGLPVSVDIVAKKYQIVNGVLNAPPEPDATPYIEEIDSFLGGNQVSKFLKLYANAGNNTQTNYSFRISKPGYRDINITASTQPATSTGVNRHLISYFEKICRNWNGSQYMTTLGDDCIYDDRAMPMTGQSITTELSNGEPYLAPTTTSGDGNYYWPVGEAYINGFLLLTGNGSINNGKENLTEYTSARFYSAQLLPIPCTVSPTPVRDVAQKARLTIPQMSTGNGTLGQLYAANAESFRSFDYRTGTTGGYTTVYHSNPNWVNSNSLKFNWGGNVSASGNTSGSGTLGRVLNYGSPILPVGPFFGIDISSGNQLLVSENDFDFYLESKTPGVPFEITNIKDAFVLTSAQNQYNQSVTAGDYSAGAPITVETITPNANVGIGENIARNWMGGYNVELEFESGGSPTPPSGPVILQPPQLLA